MNKSVLAKSIAFPFLVGLVLLAVACAGNLPSPTATAIPLAATATPLPRPSRSVGTATASRPAIPPQGTESPTPVGPSRLGELDEALARRTAEGFLRRLAKGDIEGALTLYGSDTVRQRYASSLPSQFAASNPRPVEAVLQELKRTGASSYEAKALLRWTGTEAGRAATQTLTLHLVYQRGLWWIDEIIFGNLTPLPAKRQPSVVPSPSPSAPEGRLVFQVSSGGNLYVIQADGRGLRLLTDGLDPAWSPDGSWIAFTRWRTPWGIYLIHPDGSEKQRVVDGIRFKEAAWSPDGSRLAFTLNYGSSEPIEICFFGFCFTLPPFSLGQLWVADLESGKLLSLPLDDRAVHAPTWSPTQNRIVYAGDRGLAWIDLEQMEKGRFEGGSVWDSSPNFSPDGQQIVYMSRVHDHWDLFTMRTDGSGRRPLTSANPGSGRRPNNVAPTWSPDGRQIAFLSDRDGLWRIYVMDADGSHQRPMFGDQLDRLHIQYEWASERVLSWTR